MVEAAPGIYVKVREIPVRLRRPERMIGQHNEGLCMGVLGLSRERLGRLKEAGVIWSRPSERSIECNHRAEGENALFNGNPEEERFQRLYKWLRRIPIFFQLRIVHLIERFFDDSLDVAV